MKKADIKTGFLCNNNCRFCVQGEVKKKLGNKSTGEVRKILKDAAKDCEIVVFTGGEPTIRNDIVALVKYAKKLNFKIIQMQTNGRMFVHKKFCVAMIKAGVNEFGLSLHGHTPELHNRLTGANSFYQTITGIKNLIALNQFVAINIVITKLNYRYLPEIIKLLIGLRVEHIQLAFVHATGSAKENFNSIVPRKSIVMPYVKKALDIGRLFNRIIKTEAIPYCFLTGYYECISENTRPDGKIYYEFDKVVLHSTYVRRNIDKKKGPACKQCKYYIVCEGPWKEYPDKFGWTEFIPIKNQ